MKIDSPLWWINCNPIGQGARSWRIDHSCLARRTMGDLNLISLLKPIECGRSDTAWLLGQKDHAVSTSSLGTLSRRMIPFLVVMRSQATWRSHHRCSSLAIPAEASLCIIPAQAPGMSDGTFRLAQPPAIQVTPGSEFLAEGPGTIYKMFYKTSLLHPTHIPDPQSLWA